MKFSELDEAAKAYAVDKYNDTTDSWWSESVIEMAKEDGKELGFDIDEVHFSGFWSQGDGASWEGHIDVVKWCTNQMEADPKYRMLRAMAEGDMIDQRVKITQSGHYYHQYTMLLDTIDVTVKDEAMYEGVLEPLFVGLTLAELLETMGGDNGLEDLMTGMLESARDYAAKIYHDLEEKYEYMSSEEAFAETAEANEWLFDETGEME